jgi:hypothetical protein
VTGNDLLILANNAVQELKEEKKMNGYLRQDNATANTTNFSALLVPLHQQLSHSVCGLAEPHI